MDFLTGNSIWVYLFIFFGKILEVTVATIRMVLINRGERTAGSIIAIFEITIWLLITGTVLAGFKDDLIKVVVFALAFACGNYFGSWLESKLAYGLSTLQVIVPETGCFEPMLEAFRMNDFAVTVMDGEGKEGNRKILLIHLKRKRISHAMKIVNKINRECVVTVSDVKVLRGGYIKK